MTYKNLPISNENSGVILGAQPHPLVLHASGNARFAHDEFFAGIDNPNTESSYRRAITRFLNWCGTRRLQLTGIGPADVSEYLKTLARADGTSASKPTRKLHLAALRKFFDKLVERHAIVLNPASAV